MGEISISDELSLFNNHIRNVFSCINTKFNNFITGFSCSLAVC